MDKHTLYTEAQTALSDFDEVLKKRGKSRTQGIDSWFDQHPLHHFALIDTLARDTSASRRKLIAPRLLAFSPTERDQDAYDSMLKEFILGGKPTLRALAVDALSTQPEQSARLLDVLCAYASRAPSRAEGLKVLDLIAGALQSPTPPDPTKAVEHLDPVLDHWSGEVAERAAELTLLQGTQPRESMWKHCPLSDDVRRQLARLGARITGTPDPEAARTVDAAQWQRYDGSVVEPVEMSWPAAYFIRHVHLPKTMTFFSSSYDGDGVSQEATPEFRVHEEGGKTYHFCLALDRIGIGVSHCLDVTEPEADPMLYEYDGTLCPQNKMSRLFSLLTT